MRFEDLIPPPYARAVACAGPCAWCGSDGAHALASGAALSRDVTLSLEATLSRVGLWVSLPDAVRALRVYVMGAALDDGIITPTALRIRAAEPDATVSSAWRGSSLSRVTFEGRRALVAELRAPSGRSERHSRVAVIELAGLVRAVGEADLSLRVVADMGGCLTQSITVRVDAAPPSERAVAGAYVAFVASPVEQAARVARWADRVVGALVEAGALRGVAAVRASGQRGAGVEGVAAVSEAGVEGVAWREALRGMAAGRASWVELWDPRDPESAGISVALGTRARPSPCEMSAWAASDEALEDAWWCAAESERDGTLQAIVGRWREPVTPRVLTAWERSRGVERFAAESAWLSRYVRAPGERGRIRGARCDGEALRACWPAREGQTEET